MNTYSHGKLTDEDEGDLRIALTELENRIVIDFGKKVHWIGFTKEQAKEFGTLLIKKSEQ